MMTTIQARRRQRLATMQLSADELAEAAHLSCDHVLHLVAQGVLDDARVSAEGAEPTFRPFAVALALGFQEIAELGHSGRIDAATAMSAWQHLRPQLADGFDGLVSGQYDISQFTATLTPQGGTPITLTFMQRAIVGFLVG